MTLDEAKALKVGDVVVSNITDIEYLISKIVPESEYPVVFAEIGGHGADYEFIARQFDLLIPDDGGLVWNE